MTDVGFRSSKQTPRDLNHSSSDIRNLLHRIRKMFTILLRIVCCRTLKLVARLKTQSYLSGREGLRYLEAAQVGELLGWG